MFANSQIPGAPIHNECDGSVSAELSEYVLAGPEVDRHMMKILSKPTPIILEYRKY